MRLFRFDDPAHQEAAELLPWLVNDTLSRAERIKVQRHVAECIACKQEVAHLRTLQASLMRYEADPAATQGLARLQPRLARGNSRSRGPRLLRTALNQWQAAQPWLRGAVIAQSIAIALLALLWIDAQPPKYYHTLSKASAPSSARAAAVVVIFDGAMSQQELRALLAQLHARIVDGPSPAGAYTLEVPQAQQQSALAHLRAQSRIRFAEPAMLAPDTRR